MAAVAKLAERDSEAQERTRRRILDGALSAVARHGLAKLGMSDVSRGAGVSRGTLYRYFPTREVLLEELAAHVQARFVEELRSALSANGRPGPLFVGVRYVTTRVASDPAIRRLIETEPAFVIAYVREHRVALRRVVDQMVASALGSTARRKNAVSRRDLSEWLSRALVSAVLFPDPDGEGLARSLTAVLRAAAGR